jgi:small subunit ribosomal protein S5
MLLRRLKRWKKNIITTKALSIPHDVVGDFGAIKRYATTSIEGSGVMQAVQFICSRVAGVKNVIAKQLGSNNLLNNARASIVL